MVFDEAVVKQGFLEKRGHGILVSWTTRWFILTRQKLAYFTDQTLSYKKGEYVLDSTYSLDMQATDGAHDFLFCLKRNGKMELMISAPNLPTMKSWEEALSNVLGAIKAKSPPLPAVPIRRSSAMPILNYVRDSMQAPPKALPPARKESPTSQRTTLDTRHVPIKSGYLYKQGHMKNSWKERWFELTDKSLTYFTDDTQSVMKGVVILTANSSIVEVPAKFARAYSPYENLLCLYSSSSGIAPAALERRGSFSNVVVGNAAAVVGMKRGPTRSALLLSATDKESMLQWLDKLNDCILKLRHRKYPIIIQVSIANGDDGRIFTNDAVYKISTIVNRKVKYIAYHHFLDMKEVHTKIRTVSTDEICIRAQFPRTYKRSSFGVELGAEETEQRRHDLEVYLQELIGKYHDFDFLNELGGTNDVQFDIASLFGTTPQNLNDVISDAEIQNSTSKTPQSKIAGLFDKYQDADEDDVASSAPSSTTGEVPPTTAPEDSAIAPKEIQMPTDASELWNFNVIELGLLCDSQHIDTSDYKSKKQYIEALSSTYQKALPYLHNKEVRPIVQRLVSAMSSSYVDSSVNIEIDKIFVDLMRLLTVSESLLGILSMEYSTQEKLDIIEQCVALWDKDFHFAKEDAAMIAVISTKDHLNSFLILALKYRMQFASAANAWMHCFCVRHGVDTLVAAVDRCLERSPLTERLAADVLTVFGCFRIILQTDCRAVVVDTRGAINAFVMALRFEHRALALEALELLSEVIIFGGEGAVWRVVHAFHHLALERRETPFAFLVSAISECDVEIQSSIVMLINSILLYESKVHKRIEFRNSLLNLGFDKICAKFRVEYSKVGHASSSTPTGLLESQDDSHLLSEKDREGENELSPPRYIRLRNGMYYSDRDLAEEYTDNSSFVARPESGTMQGYMMEIVFPPSDAGYTWQVGDVVKTVARRLSGIEGVMTAAAKEISSDCMIATNRQWYKLQNGILSWGDGDNNEVKPTKRKSITTKPFDGSIDLAQVKDIVDCSCVMAKTNLDLQNSFTIVNCDGSLSHFYVTDVKIKHRWLVALNVAFDRILLRRSAYRLPANKQFPTTTLIKLHSTFTKYMSIYDSVCKEDLALIYESTIAQITEETSTPSLENACDSTELATFIQYELKRHRNEDKFKSSMKDLATYVSANYAPRPPEEEDPRAVAARLPRAVPPNDKPIPAVPPLPFIPASKPAKQPRKKIKQIFWTKIKPVNVWNTVWMDLEEPENLSWSLLEELYGEVVRRRRAITERMGSAKTTDKPTEVSLFDAKRTQNVAIACGKLRRTPEEIFDLVVSLDPDELTHEVNDTIMNLLLPTKEELVCVRAYTGEFANLDFVGKLFTYFLDIERLEERLHVHRIMLNWMEEASAVIDQIDCIKLSLAELNDDLSLSSLELVLATVLSVGNYMNGAGRRGQAHGFKLEVLLKLKNIKQVGSGKKHLLHFIVEQISLHFPDNVMFYESWNSMWRASKVNLKHLETRMSELERAIGICETEITAASAMENETMRAPLVENLSSFISRATSMYEDLCSAMEETSKSVQRAKKYFGENQLGNSTSLDDDPWQSFFTLLVRFADMYKVALNDVAEWKIQEEKAKTHKLRIQDMHAAVDRKQENRLVSQRKNVAQPKEKSADDVLQTFKSKMLSIRKAVDNDSGASDDESSAW